MNSNNNKQFLITFSSVSRSGQRPNEPQTPTSRLMLTRREFQAFPKFFSISSHTVFVFFLLLFVLFLSPHMGQTSRYAIDLFFLFLREWRNPPYTHRLGLLPAYLVLFLRGGGATLDLWWLLFRSIHSAIRFQSLTSGHGLFLLFNREFFFSSIL